MNDLNFVFQSLKSRWLNSSLSILLTAFGLSIALLVSQFGNHIQNRLNQDGKNIDIVVGAKGSPLQLILSSVYHIDLPAGNIPYESIEKLIKHPQVKSAIPLALGDNWKGFRIIGTTNDYINHYNAKLNKGRFWDKEFEIVAGSSVDIKINDEFFGSHGLLEGGNTHNDAKYNVVGVLESTGTVLDRLLLTSINSVLEIHGHEEIEHHDEKHLDEEKNHHHDEKHLSEEKNMDEHHKDKKTQNVLNPPQITSLLITTKSPVANVNLPKLINKESQLQAANPSLEITRLTSMLGLGSKSFIILSTILIFIAVLTIFSGLASNLENRMGDLAILRAIGYSKKRIFKIISLEGMIIVISGIILGILIGIFSFNIITQMISPLNISQAHFNFEADFIFIIFLVLFAGLIAAMFPAYNGSKISVANQLSKNI